MSMWLSSNTSDRHALGRVFNHSLPGSVVGMRQYSQFLACVFSGNLIKFVMANPCGARQSRRWCSRQGSTRLLPFPHRRPPAHRWQPAIRRRLRSSASAVTVHSQRGLRRLHQLTRRALAGARERSASRLRDAVRSASARNFVPARRPERHGTHPPAVTQSASPGRHADTLRQPPSRGYRAQFKAPTVRDSRPHHMNAHGPSGHRRYVVNALAPRG